MYKLITALCLSIVFSVAACAQTKTQVRATTQTLTGANNKNNLSAEESDKDTGTTKSTSPGSEYQKNEFYLGYSNQQVDNFGRTTFQGFQGAYTRNVSRWFGIRGDFSYARNDRTLHGSLIDPVIGSYNFQQSSVRSVTNVLGGVQIKDNASTNRFKPFAFALGGVAFTRNTFKNLACASVPCPASIPLTNNFSYRDTSLAGAFGGGLDIKVTERIDFRAFQIDYNPIFSNGRVDNNFRIGIGVVFR